MSLDAIADGLEERAEAEVSDASEDALGGACDEGEGVVGEDGVGESSAIELGADEGEDVVGGELSEEDGVGDATAKVVVRREGELGEELGLCDEDEVVALGKVLEEETKTPEITHVEEVGVVDDWGKHLSGVIDAMCLLDESLLAAVVAALEVDLKGLA